MTKNEIVSHNLQLVMDALSDDEYKKFMNNFISIGNGRLEYVAYNNLFSALFGAFVWEKSKEGFKFWDLIAVRQINDN